MMYDEQPINDFLHRLKANRSAVEFEGLLRSHFPDFMPMVTFGMSGMQLPLAQVLVNRNRGQFHDLLPAVNAVYNRDDVETQSEMLDAFSNLMSKPYDPDKWKDPLWAAVGNWGNKALGETILQSTIDKGASYMVGLFLKPEREICARIADFHRMGVDLDVPREHDLGAVKVSFNMLAFAVSMRSTLVVGQLLGYGCDPECVVSLKDEEPVTAMSLAVNNAENQGQEPALLAKSLQTCTMLRSAIAKKHALLAIEEMAGVGLDAPARP